MWAMQFIAAYALLLAVPGPNVIAVAGQAALYGKRATLPYSVGVALGAAVLFAAVAFGRGMLGPVGELSRLAAFALLFVAWNIARAGMREPSPEQRRLAVGAGFMLAVTNPVTFAFFVAQVLSTHVMDTAECAVITAIVPAMALGNACLMAFLFSQPWVRARVLRHRRVFALGTASCLALLAVRIAMPL